MANPDKKAIGAAVDWLETKGAEAFEASLSAGGVLAEDYVRVCAAVDGLLTAGLTRDAIIVLIEMQAPRAKNGSRISAETIGCVLTGMEKMRELLLPNRQAELTERITAKPEVREVISVADKLSDAELKALVEQLSLRKKARGIR